MQEQESKLKLDSYLLNDPYSSYEGFDLQNDPSGINIPEILRLRKMWKCYGMNNFGKYRYKVFGENSHWLPGAFAYNSNLNKIDLQKVPDHIPLKKMLAETHKELYTPEFTLAEK